MAFILRAICATFFMALMVALPRASEAQPAFSKVFSANTIGSGSTSILTFTINNAGGSNVTDLAFIDNLPAAISLATPANPTTNCADGTLIAVNGGTSVSYSGGRLAAGDICTLSVVVTASTPGTHTNTTGDLTSSAGNSGTATDDLTVDGALPLFDKTVAPNPINPNDPFTVEYTIDNTANATGLSTLNFTETFPSGVTVAPVSNLSTTCGNATFGSNLTANPGSSTLSFFASGFIPSFPALAGLASCTITVDLVSAGFNSFDLVSGDLSSGGTNAGPSRATVMVNTPATNGPTLIKRFDPGASGPGGTVQLVFDIVNTTRDAATNIAFSDDLNVMLAGAAASNVPTTACGGALSGTSTLSLTGASLASGESCSFAVDVVIPGGASPATYTNTTSALTATVGGIPFTGAVASDTLEISAGTPQDLQISFLSSPVAAGSPTTLRYTITNPNPSVGSTEVAFSQVFSGFGGLTASSTPGANSCGAGSSATFTPAFNPAQPCDPCDGIPARFELTAGSLPPGGMCTFDLTLVIPGDLAGGSYPTETTRVTSDAGTGSKGADTLSVNGGVSLNFSKAFPDGPADAGATTTLEFTIASSDGGTATGLSFSDDLNAMLAGTTAIGLPLSDPCGAGSTLSGSAGDSLLTLTGGNLAGGSCTFSVTLNVPAGAATGDYFNTTDALTGAGGVGDDSATATLSVLGATGQPPIVTQQFIGGPFLPGETATLRTTITKGVTSDDITGIFFTENLSSALSGLAAVAPLPVNPCGVGSALSGTTFLIFVGGTLPSGTDSCTFDVTVQIPAGAASATYPVTTSNPTSVVNGGAPFVGNPASAALVVEYVQLEFTKQFTDDPVLPGGAAALEFTLTNPTAQTVSDLAFSDDLDAMLSGAQATSATANTCGGMATSGFPMSNFDYAGGSLVAGASCTITLSVSVPGAAAIGSYDNVTSDLTGMAGALAISASAASDTLLVASASAPTFSKSFDASNYFPGDTATLSFTITNPDAGTLSNLSFTDDLNAMLAGAVATNLPLTNVCGSGSNLSGTSLVTLSGATVPPSGGSCSFDVDVLLPALATPGGYSNTTSDLFQNGLTLANPATASLTVDPPAADVSVTKTDGVTSVVAGNSLTYTIVAANAGPFDDPSVTLTDTFPGVLTCTYTSAAAGGATGNTAAGSGNLAESLSLPSGSSVTYTASCMVDASATGPLSNTATVAGSLVDLVAGNNSATDANTVIVPEADLSITLSDSADPVLPTGTLTYTVDVANAGPSDATGVDGTFTLPAGLTFVSTSGCSGDPTGVPSCSLGTIAAGSSASYTVTATVDASTSGTVTATASVTSTVTDTVPGNNATSEDTAVTPRSDVSVTKTDGITSIRAGETLVYTLVVANAGPSEDPNVIFGDPFPADLSCNYTSVAAGGATGNTAAGSGDVNDTLSMPMSSSVTYTASCLVAADAAGTLSNTAAVETSITDPDTSNNSATDDDTVVIEPVLDFTKAFAPVAINQGQVSTLTFTIDNSVNALAADDLAFSDVFPAGMEVANPPNVVEECPGTFAATAGDTSVNLSGGSVPFGEICRVSVDIRATAGGVLNNTTSDLTSTLPTATPASATLTVNAAGAPNFTKLFGPNAVEQGQQSNLTFTIDNSASFIEATNMAFSDDFPSGLEVADPANVTSDCGGSFSASPGATSVSLSGGEVAAGASCTVEVAVRAVGNAPINNITSDLTSSLPTALPAMADLTVNSAGAPVFTKAFTPDTVDQGAISTMSFVIDNTANQIGADTLAFSDDFPSGMEVADPANTTNSCGGTFSAASGDTSISLSAGSVGQADSCTIEVDVRASAPGTLSNTTSDLTSSLPTAAAASADLTVNAALAPGFAKAFAPDVINQGGTSVLSFTIDNSTNSAEAGDLAFTDSFPAGLQVAAAPGVSNSCGGSVTASGGDTSVSLSGGAVAPGETCVIDVSVQGLIVGVLSNTTSDLTSSLATAAAASATLTVNALPLDVSMQFTPSTIEQGQTTTLIYTLSNSAAITANSVTLSDTFPAGVILGSPAASSTSCTGGTLTAADGGDTVSYTGGTTPASGSCTIRVDVTSADVGSYSNSTEAVASSLGTSAPANATLTVEPSSTGTLTIVQNTDTDGAYGFSSPTAALNFTINTAGGTGSQGPITLPAGSYAMTQATPDGVGNTRITCSDGDSTGEARNRTLRVNLDALEAVTCTITSISSRQKTVDTINRFLSKRADLILSSEPPSGRRIDRLKRGVGGSTPLSFANGDLNSFLPFSAQLSTASDSYSLSTSFLQMRQAAASLALAHGDQRGIRHIPNYRWDAWFEAQYKKFDAGPDTGHFAIAYFGADYLVNDNLLIGALVQIDDMEDNSASLSSSVDGTGWMMGPYMTARLAPNLYFDGRVAVGTSTNNISPFNTYTDEFTTDRWMAMAGITGDFQRGNWNIQPGASLSYFEETQHAYTDSIGVGIPSQTISLAQVKIGPTFTGQFQTPDGMNYSPYMSLDAIYNFGDTKGVTVTNLDTASTDGWRGRMQAGVDFNLKNGTSISFGGSYDGIFRNQLDIWGLSFELNIPIQKAQAK